MKTCLAIALFLAVCLLTGEATFPRSADTTGRNLELFNESGYVRGITMARAIGLVELALGVACLVMAVRAKKRSFKPGAKAALILGLITTAFCVVHLVVTAGAIFGSGSGKAGSIIAMILCLVGVAYAGRTLRFD